MSPTHLMSLTPRITPRTARRIAAACGVGVLALGATACGSDDPTDASAGTGQQGAADQGAQDVQGGQRPGANGKVAAVTDNTAQVQSQDGQVAVTWNGSTTFTQQVAASLDDVQVGTCVMVQPEEASGSTSGTDTDTTKVRAGTVRITAKASDGTCSGGFAGGGPGGGGPQVRTNPDGGAGGGQPPAGGPGDGAPQVRGFGALGEVTAVSASGFMVKATVPDFGDGQPSAGSTPTLTEQDVAVTVTSGTTYTTTGTATAADVKVGTCLRADGTTDSTGAVTAKTVALSPAVDGECGMVFRRGTPPDGAGDGGTTTQES